MFHCHISLLTVMSAGQVGSRFRDGSDSTGRSCRSAVTRLISDRSSYSEVVTRPIFRSIGLQCPSDLTDWGSGLNGLDRFDIRLDIARTNQWFWSGFITVVGDNVTGMLITARFLINCPLHGIMWCRIATVIQPDSTDRLDRKNRTRSILKLTRSTM